MKIRPMRWSDIAAVASIEADVFPDTAWSTEQFWAELAQSTRRYVVAVDDSEIIGYGGVYLLAPDADIQTIAVHPMRQGSGLGKQLLAELMAQAMQADCTSMMLEVASSNESAIALYTSHGFTGIHRRPDYYGPGNDAIIMRRRPLVSP
jgi:ribosomal-protein-alanine N-acetyltransferase